MVEPATFAELVERLSEGINLCVRARKLDMMERTQDYVDAGVSDLESYAPRHNALNPHIPVMTRSATPAVWALDQYERDLAAWETSARELLMRLPEYSPESPEPIGNQKRSDQTTADFKPGMDPS